MNNNNEPMVEITLTSFAAVCNAAAETNRVMAAAEAADRQWREDIENLHQRETRPYRALRSALIGVLRLDPATVINDDQIVSLLHARLHPEAAQDSDRHQAWPAPETTGEADPAAVDGTDRMQPVYRPVLGAPCDTDPWQQGDSVEVLTDDWHVFVRLLWNDQNSHGNPDGDLWHTEITTVDLRFGSPNLHPQMGAQILIHENDTTRNRLVSRAEHADPRDTPAEHAGHQG